MESVVVVGAVFRCGDDYLACRRASHKRDGGLWEFPGGKVEPGETARHALVREISEELGLQVIVGPEICRASAELPGRRVDLTTFFVTPVGPIPARSRDHDELRWLPASSLSSLDWSAPDLATVSVLASHEGSHSEGGRRA